MIRWTPVMFFRPKWFIEDHQQWSDIDIREFTDEYEWSQDELNGVADFASHPVSTHTEEGGDCEDYAILVASAIHSRGERVTIAFLGNGLTADHVIAYDGEWVYSSGAIMKKNLDDYLADSKFSWIAARTIEPGE